LKTHTITGIIILIFAAGLVLAAGCTGTPEDTQEPKEITIGYTAWTSEIASSSVLEIVYEKAGYKVNKVMADPGMLYQALADGDVDIDPGAWLPTYHQHYLDKYQGKIELVGKNLEGISVGLAVPAYVEIDSIDQLNSVKEKTGGRIVSLEAGSSMTQFTQKAIDEYGLDYEVLASSETAMLSELKRSLNKNEWIVFTGWRPHWAFMRWDLKMLKDPKEVFGTEEFIGSVARTSLKEDDPEAYGIFERFSWSKEDIESVMEDRESGTPEKEAAQKWVDNNPEKVNIWLGQA